MSTIFSCKARARLMLPAALLVVSLALSACQTAKEGERTSGGQTYDALMRIADTTRAQGDLFSAATMYRRAHQASQNRVEPLIALGAVLVDMGNSREALDVWRQALSRDTGNADALRGYGRALIALEQPEEAARQYAAALARDPKDRKALNGLGVAKDMMRDHRGAQEQFRAALAIAPDDPATRNNLGFSLALSGEHAEAIAILEPLAAQPSATPQVRQNLALAYGLAGREADAARVARLDLAEADVQRNLAYYREARVQGGASAGHPAPGASPPAAAVRTPVTAAPVTIAPPAGPATAAPPAAGGVRVQLAAFPSETMAQNEWDRLLRKHPLLFQGREPIYVAQPPAEGRRPLVHLRVGFTDRAEAAQFCEGLTAAKRDCTILRPR
ncbi:MAG TPA: tetratricopeptide repeat protein [Azospirillum sp.]|nr:tetratricopeptide repeat protein [Azospirillum sp.]